MEAAGLATRIIQDFEPVLESLTLQAYADGRFDVFLEGTAIYRAPEHRYRLPDYDEDIRSAIDRLNEKRAG